MLAAVLVFACAVDAQVVVLVLDLSRAALSFEFPLSLKSPFRWLQVLHRSVAGLPGL